MTIRVLQVHPSITVVEYDGQNIELPTTWFPERPSIGQTWSITFDRQRNDDEKVDELNRYIA